MDPLAAYSPEQLKPYYNHKFAKEVQMLASLAVILSIAFAAILASTHGTSYFLTQDALPCTVVAGAAFFFGLLVIAIAGAMRMRATREMKALEPKVQGEADAQEAEALESDCDSDAQVSSPSQASGEALGPTSILYSESPRSSRRGSRLSSPALSRRASFVQGLGGLASLPTTPRRTPLAPRTPATVARVEDDAPARELNFDEELDAVVVAAREPAREAEAGARVAEAAPSPIEAPLSAGPGAAVAAAADGVAPEALAAPRVSAAKMKKEINRCLKALLEAFSGMFGAMVDADYRAAHARSSKIKPTEEELDAPPRSESSNALDESVHPGSPRPPSAFQSGSQELAQIHQFRI